MHRFAILTVLIAASIQLNPSIAQSQEPVLVDVDSCIDLATRDQQLECYEQRVNEAIQARGRTTDTTDSESTPASVEQNSAPEQSRSSRRAQERLARDQQRRELAAEEAAEAAAEATLRAAEAAAAAEDPNYTPNRDYVATITALREMEPDAYIITLDNGQVWRQSSPKRYLLTTGIEVRLRPGRFGPSYRLTNPDVGGFIQVRRLN